MVVAVLTDAGAGAADPIRGVCAIPACGVEILPTRLLCDHHWRRIPMRVRTDLCSLWSPGRGVAEQSVEFRARLREAAAHAVAPAMTGRS